MDTVNNDIKETSSAPTSVPAPPVSVLEVKAAPAPAVNVEMPKTTGKTPGGWNRFAGYNPNDAKNKKNDRRDNKGRR